MKRLLFLILVAGCQKPAAPAAADGGPMSANEEDRSLALCTRYVERVCACAEKDATLRDACELAKGQPEAVRMHLDVLHGAPLAQISPTGEIRDAGPPARRPPLNEGERRLTESSLRKVVAACVKLDAELEPTKCPRK